MSEPLPNYGGQWTFYLLGLLLIILGAAIFIVPLLARSDAITNIKIPWYVVYIYKSGGFYFVTSPILLAISAILFIAFLLRR
jgi:hypothetical protein